MKKKTSKTELTETKATANVKSEIMDFLVEINKTLVTLQTGIEIVLETRYDTMTPIFVTRIKENIYISGGVINFTNNYFNWISNIGKKYFDYPITFNNSGNMFGL